MLEHIPDLPEGIIGFTVIGKLETEDYRDVLLPALERAASSGGIRILIQLPEFEGFSPGAIWQDLKMGVENWSEWKRIALVTDIAWMRNGVEWFGWMTPGEVKHFPVAERDAAIDWLAG
jgi:hypothetical protein